MLDMHCVDAVLSSYLDLCEIKDGIWLRKVMALWWYS